ncbi:MAG: hypothetical protein HW404_1588 [Anaerolineales bacterium]|nr:hypothetical protein [Anaerolineales bacterium]MBM2843751.1 hypothetical protein [Anaerolineales bacterium]
MGGALLPPYLLKDPSLPLPSARCAGGTFLQGEGQGWGESGTAIGGVAAE